MLLRKQNNGIRRFDRMHPIVFLPVFISIIIVFSNCTRSNGSIEVLDNPDGKGFTVDLGNWTSGRTCEISLNKGDTLLVDIDRETGSIALEISGRNGSEPYTGNNLKSGRFTVTVSETDMYDIRITGRGATGRLIIEKK